MQNSYMNYASHKGWDHSTFGKYSGHEKRIFELDILPFIQSFPANTKCIDIGFGNGMLLSNLFAHGYKADGVEIIPSLIDLAVLSFPGQSFFSCLSLAPDLSYDYAFCWTFLSIYLVMSLLLSL